MIERSPATASAADLRYDSAADPRIVFEALLAPVLDTAYRMAVHLTRSAEEAEDLVQEAAVKCFQSMHQFQIGTNFKAWFLRVLVNGFYARCRKAKRQGPNVSLDRLLEMELEPRSLSRSHGEASAAFVDGLDAERIGSAIHALPEEFRAVVSLYFIDELSYKEIAEIVSCPLGTVRSRLHRGRSILMQSLRQIGSDFGLS